MKKAMISVAFDAEKLSAAKLYMAQKDLSFEDELEKAAEALYGKYVPAGVREFIELNAESKAAAKPKSLARLLLLLWAYHLQPAVIPFEKPELRH